MGNQARELKAFPSPPLAFLTPLSPAMHQLLKELHNVHPQNEEETAEFHSFKVVGKGWIGTR